MDRPAVWALPEGEKFVAMVQFQDRIVVASERHVWVLIDDKLCAVELVPAKD